jgi:hypothetical protein
MAGKVYVAMSEYDDHTSTFHGVFSTGKKAKAIFGKNDADWERVPHYDGSWAWVLYDEYACYVVSKTKIDNEIGRVDA